MVCKSAYSFTTLWACQS